jgi:MFS transporter, PAT family, beta-lactamase induction signal transducer AmpG
MNPEPEAKTRKSPPPWVFSIYFAEGFPYSLVRQLSTVFFKDQGASLEWVGFTSLYGLPWVFKFLWSPFIDSYGTKRKWLLSVQLLIALFLVVLSALSLLTAPLAAVGLGLLLLAFFSATNDIASDGYYLEALDKKEQSKFVGFQAMSYRLALITGGGGILYLSSHFGWSGGFLIGALIFSFFFLFHFKNLPVIEKEKLAISSLAKILLGKTVLILILISLVIAYFFIQNPRVLARLPEYQIVPISGLVFIGALLFFPLVFPLLKRSLAKKNSLYSRAFLAYLDRPKIVPFLAFLVLYRLGESITLNMLYPMLNSIGIERGNYGIIYGTFGVSASILGGITGGALIARFGLKKMAWTIILAQNLPNLLYAVLGTIYEGDLQITQAKFLTVSSFVVFESFGSGMGTAMFMVLIMRSTLPDFKAANMATATGVMNLSASMVGLFSGKMASLLGFPMFFVVTFILTIPSMLLLPFIPFLDENKSGAAQPDLIRGTSNEPE